MFGAFSQNFVLLPFIHVHNWATHNWATQLHNWATHIHNWATHNWATQWHNWAIGWDFISVFVVIKPNYFQLTNFEYHRNSISKFFCWSDYQDFTRNWPFLDLFLGHFGPLMDLFHQKGHAASFCFVWSGNIAWLNESPTDSFSPPPAY